MEKEFIESETGQVRYLYAGSEEGSSVVLLDSIIP
jgi:hypothetical protein